MSRTAFRLIPRWLGEKRRGYRSSPVITSYRYWISVSRYTYPSETIWIKESTAKERKQKRAVLL